jgi:hypothetical protein
MTGSDNSPVGGHLYSEYDIQTRLRKYAQDKKAFQFLVLYEKDATTILKVISEKFGTVPPSDVTDFIFRYPEMSELPYEFTPHASNSSPYNQVSLANDVASSLHSNHHLGVKGLYTKIDGTTDESTTRTATYPLMEQARVLDVGLPDSAGAGYTYVKVRRMWPFDSPGTVSQITTAMTLILVNNTSREDGLPNPAVSMNSSYEWNTIETTRESYGVSEHIRSGIETFLLEKPLDTALRLCQIRYAKTVERAILTGMRANKKVGQKTEYETGGILEFIAANASTNMISFNKIIQPKNFNWLVKDLFDAVGCEELWLFGGTNYVTALANAYENKVNFSKAEAESLKYAMKVFSLEAVGRPGKLFIAGAPVLNQIGMANEAIVLNLEDKWRCYQIAEKEPLSDRPEGDETLSPKGQYSDYRELYSMWGLVRRLSKTHFWIIDTSISY